MTISRRQWLLLSTSAVVPIALRGQQPATDSLSADPLRNPGSMGMNRDTLTALDNDPVVVAIERRLRCTCGCTLDIYTCRTTDFTCTFSPALHREVMAMRAAGQDPESIIAIFVAREGEAILMAPPAEGFNIAGYVVPGLVMITGVAALLAWVSRRRSAVSAADVGVTMPTAEVSIDDHQRDALRRALDSVDD